MNIIKTTILTLLLLFSIIAPAQSQKFKFPTSAWGFEVQGGSAQVQQSDLSGNYDFGKSFTLKSVYEYNINNYFGLNSGVGFDFRLYKEGRTNQHNIISLQVPVLLQIRPTRVFSIEAGAESEFNVVNNRDASKNMRETNLVDIIGYGGVRVRMHKGLSVGLGLRWGLTPFEKYVGYFGTGPADVKSYHRGIVLNLRYLFY